MTTIAIDPMLQPPFGWAVFGIVMLKTVFVFAMLLIATMLMVWFERRVIGQMQNRIGPNRAGPFGLLQTLADGTKLLFKEDLTPEAADRSVFRYAPLMSMVPAFLTFAVIPISGSWYGGHGGLVSIFGHTTRLQLADPPVGFLFVLAATSIAVYGVTLGGWASGSKYPLFGSVRATAQMVSYEAAMGLAVATVFLATASNTTIGHRALETSAIVGSQQFWHWNLWITGIIPFVVFFIAGTAEIERPPFDLLEAEQELVGGFNTEYSAMRFGFFYLASFMSSITFAAIITTLFLGGTAGPSLGVHSGPIATWLLPFVWFLVKVIGLLYVFVWIRATVPRFRYDQLMDIGWKVLIPLSLGWLLLLAAMNIARNRNWSTGSLVILVVVAVAVFMVAYGLLAAAMRVARRLRVDNEEAFD